MSNSDKFWDRFARRYARMPVKNPDAYALTMDRTRAHLSKDDTVLEFGCGTGSTALLLADSVKQITASDISANMIEIAAAKARDQQVGNVTFVRGTVFDEAFDGKTFDSALAFNILHLLDDLPAAIRRVHTLLNPDGLFISKTVCMAGQGRLWAILLPIMRAVGFAPSHVSFLAADELEGAIASAGFEIIESGDHSASPPCRFIVARKRP